METLTDSIRSLGLSLAVARMSLLIQNRLKSEQVREDWEGLKRGTLDNKEKVMDIALPEPASADTLLGFLAPEVRLKVRERFIEAL